MKTHIVEYKQSLMDVCLQRYGSLDNMVDIAILNNISIDAVLVPGTTLKLKTEGKGDRRIKNTVSERSYSFNNNGLVGTSTGIGVMAIESTFIVG